MNTPQDGGLGFESTSLGTFFMISGVIVLIYQIFCFPPLVNKFKALSVFKSGAFIAGPAIALLPISNFLVDVTFLFLHFLYFPSLSLLSLLSSLSISFFTFHLFLHFPSLSSLSFLLPLPSFLPVQLFKRGMVSVWSFVVCMTVLKVIGFIHMFSSVFMLINHSHVPSKLGAVNGLAQSLVALARSFGPSLGSVMLSWSLNNNLSFPFNFFFVFIFVALVIVLNGILAFTLDGKSINFKKKEGATPSTPTENSPLLSEN